jgi:hypothetical protein
MIHRLQLPPQMLPPPTPVSYETRTASGEASDVTLSKTFKTPRPRLKVNPLEESSQYRIAENRRELSSAFHLVYRKYRDAGLIDANLYQLRVTQFHLRPETTVFVGQKDGEVVSTVSLIGDSEAGLPMDCIYYDEVDAFRGRGWHVAEVSCLASNCDPSTRGFLTTFVRLNSLMAQSARLQGIDHLLIVIHPRHAAFYEKYVGFQSTEIVRPYPAVENHPALLLYLDLERMHYQAPRAYQRFFGEPLPVNMLIPRPMSPADCDYFRPAAKLARSFVPIPMAG